MGTWRKVVSAVAAAALLSAGCVNQNQKPEETSATGEEPRIVATTPSIMNICNMLELDLVGIPTTSSQIPDRYSQCTQVGMAMNPDLEVIASLEPTDVLMAGGSSTSAVASLIPGQGQTADAVEIPKTYVDVSSVEGLYDTLEQLGDRYGKEQQAARYLEEYEQFMADYKEKTDGKESPKVLILMGLPGSYIEATPNSYVGSLVEMAGGVNVVFDDSEEAFLTWNTEQLYELDPDVILLTAHGMPEQAMEMFEDEFRTNTVWKNFRAVNEGRVYQLDYTIFNMSATFDWMDGLNQLYNIFYENGGETFAP